MIDRLDQLLDALGGILIAPLVRSSVGFGLLLTALLTTVLALLVYKRWSNQDGIRTARNRSIAALLDIALYNEYPARVFSCVGHALAWATRYLVHGLKPLALLALPVTVILIQCNAWFAWRPPAVGESVIATARLDAAHPVMEHAPHLTASPEWELAAPPVRIPSRGEVSWALRAAAPGDGVLTLDQHGSSHSLAAPVGIRPARLSPVWLRPGAAASLLYAGPSRLVPGSGLQRVELAWPERRYTPWDLHWIWPFLVLTLAFGLVLRVPMRVEF